MSARRLKMIGGSQTPGLGHRLGVCVSGKDSERTPGRRDVLRVKQA
ncbi:MAG TPA: hypothetical protein VFN35_08485 [Ktedonobacteraceae bacterium]|nr:hypothetical protein [Ktedonobacteraceae bacterium]